MKNGDLACVIVERQRSYQVPPSSSAIAGFASVGNPSLDPSTKAYTGAEILYCVLVAVDRAIHSLHSPFAICLHHTMMRPGDQPR